MSTEIGEIFATLRAPLSAFLRKQVRDPDAAEDLLQQVFVKALVNRSAGQMVGNLTGWLYAVARTTAVDYHRSKHFQNIESADDLAAPTDDDDRHLQEERHPAYDHLLTPYRPSTGIR